MQKFSFGPEYKFGFKPGGHVALSFQSTFPLLDWPSIANIVNLSWQARGKPVIWKIPEALSHASYGRH